MSVRMKGWFEDSGMKRWLADWLSEIVAWLICCFFMLVIVAIIAYIFRGWPFHP